MTLPSVFTPLAELRIDWKQILKRIPLRFRGFLLSTDIRYVGMLSSAFKYPILAIPHDSYLELNKNIELLNSILAAVNDQLVCKFSGIKFIPPDTGNVKEIIEAIVLNLDGQIVDIIEV